MGVRLWGVVLGGEEWPSFFCALNKAGVFCRKCTFDSKEYRKELKLGFRIEFIHSYIQSTNTVIFSIVSKGFWPPVNICQCLETFWGLTSRGRGEVFLAFSG